MNCLHCKLDDALEMLVLALRCGQSNDYARTLMLTPNAIKGSRALLVAPRLMFGKLKARH